MTKITYKQENCFFHVKVEGHAGYNPGNDIVCSAISVLTSALAQTITEEDEASHLERMEIRLEDGYNVIGCKCKLTTFTRVLMAYRTVMNGFELLAATYPDNVQLEEL